MKDIYEIAVVGGGYTGLAVATELIDKGYSVILIEKTDEFGGLELAIRLHQNLYRQSVFGKCVILSNHASNHGIDPESA